MTVGRPASVEAKLDRAQEHADALRAEVDAWTQPKTHRIVLEHNEDFTEHTVRVVFDGSGPTERWGCILGDCFQSLRSALDHLVYAIAVKENGGIDPPPAAKSLMFPITDSGDAWNNTKWRIKTLSDSVRTQLEREQPDSNRLDDSALWRLEELNRADKHRVVHTTAMFLGAAEVPISGLPADTYDITYRPGPVENGTPILTVTGTIPAPEANVDVNHHLFFPICVERIDEHVAEARRYTALDSLVNVTPPAVRETLHRVASAAGL